MQTSSVPRLGPLYWLTLSSASVFGTNTGDVMSHTLGLGDTRGLPFLVAAFAAILVAERRVHSPNTVFYWLAIIVVRTAATNLADLATLQAELDYTTAIAALAALTAAILLIGGVVRPSQRAGNRRAPAGIASTGAAYWLAMLAAATLGTALGDYGSHTLTLHVSTVVTVALFAAVLWPARRIGSDTALYWGTVVIARAAGTNIGDLIAFRKGLDVGLPASTALTGLVFVGLVALGNRRRRPTARAGASAPAGVSRAPPWPGTP